MSTNSLLPDRFRSNTVLIFFIVLLGLGLSLVRDYGVSFDEGVQRAIGQVSLLYVFQLLPNEVQQKLLSPEAAAHIAAEGGDRQLATYVDRDYGVAFELPVSAAEQGLRIRDERQVYLLRHTVNFLVCYLGFVAFFMLVKRRFGSWRWGLLGTLLLVLSPRQFADYFYNDKDAVFLAFFILAVTTAVSFIERPTWRTATWHALACAIAIDIRVMGILLPTATLAFVCLRAIRGEYRSQNTAGPAGLYIVLLTGLVIIFWPYLWSNPLSHFQEVLVNMSHFRWPDSVLYKGQIIKATLLPWHYPLVWIGITIPLLYLGMFMLGLGAILSQVVRRRWRLYATDAEWQDLLFLGLGLVPLLAVIALHSVLYNGWRQLYFVYPMLLLVALRGLVTAWRWQVGPAAARYWRPVLGLGLGIGLTMIAGRMVQLHPLENIYFNALAGPTPERAYETDYWCLSYRQGLAWIAAHDSRPTVRVYSKFLHPLELNRSIQPAAVRQRLQVVDTAAQADYVLVNYSYQQPTPYLRLRYTLQAGGLRVLDIYQLH